MVPASPPAIVDCDLNGFDDACEIALDPVLDLNFDGILDECQALSADVAKVSIGNGGTQNFALHAGAAFGGHVYLLAGSITGTSGITFGSVTIPLKLDAYTTFGVIHPLTPPLFDNLGLLDAGGNASARFSSVAGAFSPTMIGKNVFHAYALIHPSGTVDLASNFVTFQFVP